MTRKDYILIALAMRGVRDRIQVVDDPADSAYLWWRVTVNALADAFQNDNERFDRDRFKAACYGLKP